MIRTNTASMAVRNGYIQQRHQRGRRRNAVANIFSEMSEGDIRALRQQARDTLHPAITGASPSVQNSSVSSRTSSDSSSSDTEENQGLTHHTPRRRRNAVPNLLEGISQASLEQLRENAVLSQHPAAMTTTPPGAPGAGGVEAGAASGSAIPISSLQTTSHIADETGAAAYHQDLALPLPESPSHKFFTVDSISSAFPEAPSGRTSGTSSRRLRPAVFTFETPSTASGDLQSSSSSSSASLSPDSSVTGTDVDIFREEVAKSSPR